MSARQSNMHAGKFDAHRNAPFSWAKSVRLLGAGAGLLIIFLVPHLLWALEVPPNHGRVNDNAGMLSTRTRVMPDQSLAGLERSDSIQVMVLTVASLQGDSLEAFAVRVFQEWGIG
jgi:uncharacterized protein